MYTKYQDIYNICYNFNFNLNEIKEFCQKKHINYEEYINQAKLYAKYYLTKKITDMNENEITFIYNNNKLFLIIQKYKKFMEENNLLYYQRRTPREIVDNIKINLFKFIKLTNFNKIKIEEKFKKWNLDFNENMEIITRFVVNQKYSKNTNEIVSLSKLTNKRIETIPVFYQKLIEAQNKEEIIDIIDNSIQKVKKERVYDFVVKYYNSNCEEVEIDIRNKFDIYNEYKEIEKKQKLELEKKVKKVNLQEKARLVIKQFINSNYININDYCSNNNLSIKKFKTYINMVKAIDQKLYNLYENKLKLVKQKKYNEMIPVCQTIVNGIKYGIEENGAVRSFDLLDYYKITNCDRITIFKILKEVLPDDVKIFGAFLRKYQNSVLLTDNNIKQILNSKQVIGIKFDKDNNPISNTGYVVTKEDKEYVFKYLIENNISLFDDVYNIALKRYLNGDLIIENDKKTLTRDK